MLKGASLKPNLGIDMKEEEKGSMFDNPDVFSSQKEEVKETDNGFFIDLEDARPESPKKVKIAKHDSMEKELPPRVNQMTKFLQRNPIFIMP